jgi:predicted ribosomally synthesized peptide with SipW-like signal peptide
MMKKTKIILPALAVILVIGLLAGPALAYFTAHTEAKGSAEVGLGFETYIEETHADLYKQITITNEGPQSVWVRVTAFSVFDLDYSGTGWTDGGDGYWYYDSVLAAGDATDPALKVEISTDDQDEASTANFNIIVIYECTPVQYDANGVQQPASWNIPATVVAQKGGE